MKLSSILLLVFFCFYNYSFSCDCPPLKKETMINDGLKYSDIVFLGEVIKFNSTTGTYTFKIIELFKGKTNVIIINGKQPNSCTISPAKKELWIVYAYYNKDKTISIGQCSPSIGFESYQGSYPPPKFEYSNIKDKQLKTLYERVIALEYDKVNLTNWITQLERLRLYKSQQNTISQKEKTDLEIENYAKYIIISLIITIVLLLVLIFLLLQKRKRRNFN